MNFLHMLKRTSVILCVTFLVIFNTVFNSFVSCCETGEELFVNNGEQACCTCCASKVNDTSLTSHWTTIDDCTSCVCIPYINNSDTFCIFTKRTPSPFNSPPVLLNTDFVETNVTKKHPVFSPAIVNQKTECLSTVVLLI
jgi:hypothetical protein